MKYTALCHSELSETRQNLKQSAICEHFCDHIETNIVTICIKLIKHKLYFLLIFKPQNYLTLENK